MGDYQHRAFVTPVGHIEGVAGFEVEGFGWLVDDQGLGAWRPGPVDWDLLGAPLKTGLRLERAIADTIRMMASPSRLIARLSLFVLLHMTLFSYGQEPRRPGALKYFHFPGQPALSTELKKVLDSQVVWDDSGQDFLNPSGVQLRFEKIDEQATPDGRSAARYRVFAGGAPENKIFGLESWPVDKDGVFDPRDIYANNQGLLMTHRPKPEDARFKAPDDELAITAVTENAEPIRFLLSSKDGQLQIFGTLVPHPVEADDQGCRIEVRIGQPGAASILIIVNGFPEKAKIPLVLQSEGSATSESLATDANGHAVIAGIPYAPGRAQGVLKATAEGPNCLPSVVLPWNANPHAVPKTSQR